MDFVDPRGRPNEAATGKLRELPQLHRLLESDAARDLLGTASRDTVAAALRRALDAARAAILAGGDPPDAASLLARATALLHADRLPALRRAVNATGIVLHTNLGRAPLAPEALAAVQEAARGYGNLELDLESGRRGGRGGAVEALLCRLTGAEAALVVNNNAAAVLLALSALAAGGEVLVSRGEMVEIGGSFRIPDVIRQGGARLVEVGTTNRTHLSDYRDAITPATRILLKVHPSNYRITGFTAAVPLADLAALARERGLLLVEDLGSGTLLDLRALGRPPEPTVPERVAAGADIVAFSGDKLLGGPQAGLLVGREAALTPLRTHPLARPLRAGKLPLAALEATLRLYLDAEAAPRRVPVLRMLAQSPAEVAARAERLAAMLGGGLDVRVEDSVAYAGGGSLPEAAIASRAVSLHGAIPVAELARRLRWHRPAVIGRIVGERLILDVLTIADDELEEVVAAVKEGEGAALDPLGPRAPDPFP